MRRVAPVALAAVVVSALTAWGGELLTNGGFASGELAPWKLFNKKDQPAATASVEPGVLHLFINFSATQPHDRQLMQAVAVESAEKYRLTFTAKTIEPGNPAMLKLDLGALSGDVYLRNLSLTPRQP